MIRQTQRPHVPRAIELALIEIEILLAEGQSEPAAARLSDLVLTTPLADYRNLLRFGHPVALSELRALVKHPTVAAITRQRLQSLLTDADVSEEPAVDSEDGSVFTGRERTVLELLSSGLSNKEIGRMLALSDNTIKFHLRNIFAKLNVSTRTAAVTAARQKGVLDR
jgi:LuxR family maltose regulon positive regulatory protein